MLVCFTCGRNTRKILFPEYLIKNAASGLAWQERVIHKVFTHLDSLGIDISSSIRCGIEEANSVVNAYKHGEEAIEKLQNTLPEYFCVTGRVESFCIPEGNLEKLFNTVHGFWDEVEAHIEPDFNWKP
jgi:hypothetical protein